MPTDADPRPLPRLFRPLTLRGVTVRNRIGVPALCQYSVFAEDGVPTDWHLVHLGSFARGGAGLVIAEATAVSPEGRISSRDTGLWDDGQADAWRRVTDFIRSQGAVPGVQLAHAGRKASTWAEWEPDGRSADGRSAGPHGAGPHGAERHGTVPPELGGWPTVSASDLAYPGYAAPRALREEELAGLVDQWRSAAARAVAAGFELIEVHAAHGYLIHQFLSPLSNDRSDAYGGPLENRARLLLEIVRAMREEVGEAVPIAVRLSATDWLVGGLDADETATVAAWTRDAGADLVDVSTGGLLPAPIPVGPDYQVPHAERIAEEGVPAAAVGLIVEPEDAERIAASGIEVVLLGRATMRDPHWTLRAARELGADVDYWPPQYRRARPREGAPW